MPKGRHKTCTESGCKKYVVKDHRCYRHFKDIHGMAPFTYAPGAKAAATGQISKFLASRGGMKVVRHEILEVTFPTGRSMLFTNGGRRIKSKIKF